jgi:hypothetical protein
MANESTTALFDAGQVYAIEGVPNKTHSLKFLGRSSTKQRWTDSRIFSVRDSSNYRIILTKLVFFMYSAAFSTD